MNDTTHPTPKDPSDDPVEKRLKSRCNRFGDDFYPTLLVMALDRIPHLQHGVVYKAQHIFGKEFWKDLDNNPLRRLVGEVLAHFVFRGKVPLRFVSCRYCTTKRYMRC
jgi:hypothetical protein